MKEKYLAILRAIIEELEELLDKSNVSDEQAGQIREKLVLMKKIMELYK